jgi:hypothetical protein
MMVIEMREAAQDKAFELIDEMKDLGRQKKMVMCELEDTLYDCFEGSKEDEEEEPKTDEGTDLGFKKSMYNRHYAMRNFEDDEDEKEDMRMRAYRRNRAMRMRRNRMGRYA